MRVIRFPPPFDHGAALRVPPPNDQASWQKLWAWLGDEAHSVAEGAAVQVRTPEGRSWPTAATGLCFRIRALSTSLTQ